MLKEIVTYQFGKDNQRIEVIDGKEWWCVLDACNILGIQNVTHATEHIPSSHLRQMQVVNTNSKSRCNKWNMLFVDEAGLNQLIMRSDKPQAKHYQEWVFSVVLPSIRKTGSYPAVPNALEQAMVSLANTFNAFMASTSTRLNDIEARLVQPTQVPKLLSQATLSKRAQFNMAMREMAKALNISYRECYGEVYKRYYYTNHINLKERAKNTHTRPIDVAEQLNCFDDLINICQNFH